MREGREKRKETREGRVECSKQGKRWLGGGVKNTEVQRGDGSGECFPPNPSCSIHKSSGWLRFRGNQVSG